MPCVMMEKRKYLRFIPIMKLVINLLPRSQYILLALSLGDNSDSNYPEVIDVPNNLTTAY